MFGWIASQTSTSPCRNAAEVRRVAHAARRSRGEAGRAGLPDELTGAPPSAASERPRAPMAASSGNSTGSAPDRARPAPASAACSQRRRRGRREASRRTQAVGGQLQGPQELALQAAEQQVVVVAQAPAQAADGEHLAGPRPLAPAHRREQAVARAARAPAPPTARATVSRRPARRAAAPAAGDSPGWSDRRSPAKMMSRSRSSMRRNGPRRPRRRRHRRELPRAARRSRSAAADSRRRAQAGGQVRWCEPARPARPARGCGGWPAGPRLSSRPTNS